MCPSDLDYHCGDLECHFCSDAYTVELGKNRLDVITPVMPVTIRTREFGIRWSLEVRFWHAGERAAIVQSCADGGAGSQVRRVNRHHGTYTTDSVDAVIAFFANVSDVLVERGTSVESNPEALEMVREGDWSSSN